MEKEINVTVENGVKKLEIYTGQALAQKEPLKVSVAGLISAPLEYLTKRSGVIEPKQCHLIVDESAGIMTLVVNEKNAYKDEVSGALKMNPDFENFRINIGHTRDTFELADFIKMNRIFFADKNTAMKLVSELKNFKAKVNKEVELSDNDRGNTRVLMDQVVNSNIPESFDLDLPIFKGQEAQKFRVEVNIDSRDLSCSLMSPDAKDLIAECKATLLNTQIELIRELVPDLAVLEV